MSSNPRAQIATIAQLCDKELVIPNYQRPYKWSERSVNLLINDLKEIADDSLCSSVRYRLGTIIVHREANKLNIVDGQQRVVTLALLMVAFNKIENENGSADSCETKLSEYSFLPKFFNSEEFMANALSRQTLVRNYRIIEGRVRFWGSGLIRKVQDAFQKRIEVVLIEVEELDQAFQIFDSQNYRGKNLAAHDLLKAYHLRCMGELSADEQISAVEKWEAHSSTEIAALFEKYLHRIGCWRLNNNATPFTRDDIDEFKGGDVSDGYLYALRTYASTSLVPKHWSDVCKAGSEIHLLNQEWWDKGGNIFQIGQPFIAGSDFFKMVDYYLTLEAELGKKVDAELEKIAKIFAEKNCTDIDKKAQALLTRKGEISRDVGFQHAYDLFRCAVLFFCDRFGLQLLFQPDTEPSNPALQDTAQVPKEAFIRLFTWAMLPRVTKQRLGFASINKFALGAAKDCGCSVNIFHQLAFARTPDEFLNLPIPENGFDDKDSEDYKKTEYRKGLKAILRTINGKHDLRGEVK